MAGSYGNSMFNYFEKMPSHFLYKLNNSTFPSAIYEGSDFSTSLSTFITVLILAILVAMKWYFFIVFYL